MGSTLEPGGVAGYLLGGNLDSGQVYSAAKSLNSTNRLVVAVRGSILRAGRFYQRLSSH